MSGSTASGRNAEPYHSYRESPSSSHISLPSINLPSIRSLEAASQQQQQQHLPAYPQPAHQQQQHPFPPPPPPPPHAPSQIPPPPQIMGSPLPPPAHMAAQHPYPPGQHPFPPPGPQYALPPSHDPNAPGRYAIAAPDGRMLQGTRHKKEIKRRTKTGCLTCRKRRIKCDESHPTCRNCQKSKRECLGYDPIFKSQQGPTAIQPAPNSASPLPVNPAASSPYSHIPPPPYAQQPVLHPYHTSIPAGTPGMADYNNIDPALQGAGGMYNGEDDSRLEVKPTNIEELLNVGRGLSPPHIPQSDPLPADKRQELQSVYLSIYGPGMDKFFDTHWFTTRGQHHLLADQRLCEKYLALMARFTITAQTNYNENLITQSLEANVIWESLLLCRQVSASILSTNDSSNQVEVDAGVHDAAKRLRIFESLVTNQQIDTEFPEKMDEFYSPKQVNALNAQLISRERSFWKHVATFCTLKDDSGSAAHADPNMDPAMAPASVSPESDKIDAVLREIRQLLDSRENRDILYSVAIARHVGQQMAERAAREGTVPQPPMPTSNDENDPKTALNVARNFIREESDGKGTTQVSQRICGMAKRSWGNR